jgi:hypothetical protein
MLRLVAVPAGGEMRRLGVNAVVFAFGATALVRGSRRRRGVGLGQITVSPTQLFRRDVPQTAPGVSVSALPNRFGS